MSVVIKSVVGNNGYGVAEVHEFPDGAECG